MEFKALKTIEKFRNNDVFGTLKFSSDLPASQVQKVILDEIEASFLLDVKEIDSFKNLTEWLIKNHRSIFLEADIPVEDKTEILHKLNYSTDMLY